jgi:uncharacterized protein (DUF4415 family)
MKENKLTIGSDLAKVDAHVIQPEEYEEAPEWTDEMFERADLYHGDKLIRRGRPPQGAAPKEAIKLRIDADVLAHFRSGGPGWQTRINEALRRAAKLKKIGTISVKKAVSIDALMPIATAKQTSVRTSGRASAQQSVKAGAAKRTPY